MREINRVYFFKISSLVMFIGKIDSQLKERKISEMNHKPMICATRVSRLFIFYIFFACLRAV